MGLGVTSAKMQCLLCWLTWTVLILDQAENKTYHENRRLTCIRKKVKENGIIKVKERPKMEITIIRFKGK